MLRQVVLVFTHLSAVAQAYKPVGQLTGTLSTAQTFEPNTVFAVALPELSQFQPDGDLKAFTHENGRLIAKRKGYYYIYAKVFFDTYPEAKTIHNRVALAINGNAFSLIQTALGEGRTDYGSYSTGIVKYLNEDDYISLHTVYGSRLLMSNSTFFGAYRIRRRA